MYYIYGVKQHDQWPNMIAYASIYEFIDIEILYEFKHLMINAEISNLISPEDNSVTSGSFAPVPFCVIIQQSVALASTVASTFSVKDQIFPNKPLNYSFTPSTGFSFSPASNQCVNTASLCKIVKVRCILA